MPKNNIYRAYAYYRLSKEDGDKGESNSITNQRSLVAAFVSKQEDIILVGEQVDDGYTGTNFERPGFQKMMKALESGVANCVIVKDLSRLGREYINTGKYIQVVFPSMQVRFIAINDMVDSMRKTHTDDLIIPFKNLMNDTYCRELSIKLRNQLRVQRNNGEFMGPHVFYGYLKNPTDKHKIVVDEEAAQVVRQIFSWYLEGRSKKKIAEMLNSWGVPSPLAYKQKNGSNLKSGFQTNEECKWGHVSVNRILTNRIYIGVLEQGKRSTPNYKVKKVIENEMADWSIVENNHVPIIDPITFATAQQIMLRDTRSSPNTGKMTVLSGIVRCGDCGSMMYRKTVSRGRKKFVYYVCATNRKTKLCSPHSTAENALYEKILGAINTHIQAISALQKDVEMVGDSKIRTQKAQQIAALIAEKQNVIEEKKSYRIKLHESMILGIFNHDEYVEMYAQYSEMMNELENQVALLQAELRNTAEQTEHRWMEVYLQNGTLRELTREVTVRLLDTVEIYQDRSIAITLNFKNEYMELLELLQAITQEVM